LECWSRGRRRAGRNPRSKKLSRHGAKIPPYFTAHEALEDEFAAAAAQNALPTGPCVLRVIVVLSLAGWALVIALLLESASK
jgi:hypothetical protein